ncbi:MerR family transcriptional regulator [Aurantiacibacter spongiae]|uniref:MerR family transcriptional regulator n=1 Tax=Aurantiacibacter spongiae TaxID=2488860 RepID=A0A3N5DTT3_9SPHN|nr:MerR family transcriptional regulator [Aurantiacibacter spongiae]RPF72851.1 MerR family transcriptional regulator [Aurantiacibacter spongiae]
MRTIGEVAAALGLKPHVLRYWEEQFPTLEPLKRSGGRRLYRAEDVALVAWIDRLVNREGYTIKGARQVIADASAEQPMVAAGDEGGKTAERDDLPGDTSRAPDMGHVLSELRAVRRTLADALSG